MQQRDTNEGALPIGQYGLVALLTPSGNGNDRVLQAFEE